jgi:hypothetical protein
MNTETGMKIDYLKSITEENLTKEVLKDLLKHYSINKIAKILKLNDEISRYTHIKDYSDYDADIYMDAIDNIVKPKYTCEQCIDLGTIVVTDKNLQLIIDLINNSYNVSSYSNIKSKHKFKIYDSEIYETKRDKALDCLQRELDYYEDYKDEIYKFLAEIDKDTINEEKRKISEEKNRVINEKNNKIEELELEINNYKTLLNTINEDIKYKNYTNDNANDDE